MVRPGRDLLTGRVEVDETYLGGLEEGLRGRLVEKKALIVIAAQEDGKGIGRIRLRQIPEFLGEVSAIAMGVGDERCSSTLAARPSCMMLGHESVGTAD